MSLLSLKKSKPIAKSSHKTVEDFIDSKLNEGDLEACGIEDEEVLDTIWTYIEKHSPNFVNGTWIN